MKTEPPSLITDEDLYLFNEGSHFRLWDKLGSHPVEGGTRFAVWAPNAEWVSVIGDHNGWDGRSNPMQERGSSGIWEAFVPGLGPGAIYKYLIRSRNSGYRVEKADPFAFRAEVPPKTGSIVWELDFDWTDAGWMRDRHSHNSAKAAMSIYEMHVGSWRRVPEEGNRSLYYWELSGRIADYCDRTGFTHVELLPIMEHPFFGSWGAPRPGRRRGQPCRPGSRCHGCGSGTCRSLQDRALAGRPPRCPRSRAPAWDWSVRPNRCGRR